MRSQKNFRCPVPSRSNSLCHNFQRLFFLHKSHQPKITHFRQTVTVNENIRGFQISVNKGRRMKIMKSFDDLVQNIFYMNFLQFPLIDQMIEIWLHVLEYQVDVTIVWGVMNGVEGNNVRMLQLPQNWDLSEGALSISGMLERIKYFLQSYNPVGVFALSFPNLPIGSLPNLSNHLILLEYTFINMFVPTHSLNLHYSIYHKPNQFIW